MIVTMWLVACNGGSQTETTGSGIVVNFVEQPGGEALKDSMVVRFNMAYVDQNGNALFGSTNQPVTTMYNKVTWGPTSQIHEALDLMSIGDSVTFEVSAENLFAKTFRRPRPDSIAADAMMTVKCGLEFQKTREEFQAFQIEERQRMMEAEKANMAKQLEEDGATIDKYLADEGINAITTESGLRYVVKEQGTGPVPTKGQTITTHYHGTFMDGKVFDSSVEKGTPFTTQIGVGRVISGWDEAFTTLAVGTKATLYIPSSLGYGTRGGGRIPANSNLIFEVELIDVK